MKKLFISILFAVTGIIALHAVPAYPRPITVRQPDGTVLTLRVHGDEYLHWTTCGNNLVSVGSDGYYQFASFNTDGASVPNGTRVSTSTSGDGSQVMPPLSAIAKAKEMRENMGRAAAANSESSSISIGEKHFLVLLIEFADTKFTVDGPNTAFGDLLNSRNYTYNGATGSAWKYYNDNSHDKFTPVYDVYGPIPVSGTSASYVNNEVNVVIEACTYADETLGVDFSQYCYADPTLVDNIFFYYAGYNQAEGGGSGTIWPHSATYSGPFMTVDGVGIYRYACTSEYRGNSGNEMAGIGTFTHEFGHTLGLPDVYDVDYGTNGSANGLGPLSLMASGNYNNNGRTPPYLTYEERHTLGWDDGIIPLTEGENTLLPIAENKSYYTPTSNEGEYYLYESRPTVGWDAYTGAAGLAIYHVDRSGNIMPDGNTAADMWDFGIHMVNAYAEHQCYDLIESVYPESQAWSSDQLVFPGSDNVTSFTSETLPAAIAWSGRPTGYNLTDISFSGSDGITTFKMGKEYRLYGIVKNMSGEPIPGAQVKVSYSAGESSSSQISFVGADIQSVCLHKAQNSQDYNMKTDENGCFELSFDKSGTCDVTINKEGYLEYNSSIVMEATATVEVIMVTPEDEAGTKLQKFKEHSDWISGFGSGTDTYGGLKYLPEELTEYVGADISSISFNVANGGTGTVDKMGVRVYFDDELQCDCESTVHIFGTFCTVDISNCKLRIPSGKSVLFAYYVLNPTFGYSCVLADWGNPIENANLQSSDGYNWFQHSNANMEIKAMVVKGGQVIDLSGINYISRKASYSAGEEFELKLVESSVNPPSSVTWTVNGETKSSGDKITLYSGVMKIRAILTFPSGRKELKDIVLEVK